MTLEQIRERAFRYVNEDNLASAASSIISDLNKIEGCRIKLQDILELQQSVLDNDGIAVLRWINDHTGA